MKYILAFLCLTSLSFCAHKQHADTPEASNGKLYVQSSIVGGLRLSWLYLGNDGVFVKNPMNGADPVNYTAEKQNNIGNIGHYTMSGNIITAKYENGKTETWKVEYLNGKLNTIDGLFVGIAAVMPAGYKVSGSYSAHTFYGSFANISTFNFAADGTFALTGTGFVNNGVATGMAKKATGGTYSVTGNTLKLNFNNGETSTSVIGVYKAGSGSFLVINGNYFG